QQLKTYFTNEGEENKAKLIPGFKFKPATYVKANLAISTLFRSFGLILSTTAPSLLATHFYKRNADSRMIQYNLFRFQRSAGGKDLGSIENLAAKLADENAGRCGYQYTNYNNHYGFQFVPHNETLLTYHNDAPAGILVTNNKAHAELAIKL